MSQQLKNRYLAAGETVPPVYVITQPNAQSAIRSLNGEVEFGVQVLTPAELKDQIASKKIEVDHLLEGPVFSRNNNFIEDIDNALDGVSEPIPLTMLPEYGMVGTKSYETFKDIRRYHLKNLKYENIIHSGFRKDKAEMGIIVSDTLATPPSPATLVNQLDAKIRTPLLGTGNITNYQENTELYMQYSHDSSYSSNHYPSKRFLHIHRELVTRIKM